MAHYYSGITIRQRAKNKETIRKQSPYCSGKTVANSDKSKCGFERCLKRIRTRKSRPIDNPDLPNVNELTSGRLCRGYLLFKPLFNGDFFDEHLVSTQQIGVFTATVGANFAILDGGVLFFAVLAVGDGFDRLDFKSATAQ